MSKHTPGPWAVRSRKVDGEIVDCFVTAPDCQGLAYDAEIMGDDEYRDGMERKVADATLIAAAPELLEALQKAFLYINGGPGYTPENMMAAYHAARAAIAKATGEQA